MLKNFTLHAFLKKQLLLTGIAGSCLATPALAQQWNLVGGAPLTTVNGSFTNLVQDNAGNYYVSYYAGGVAQGSVQKYNGTSWSFVGGQGVSPGFATYNALGVNASGELYYSFQDGSNGSNLSVKKFSPVTNTWTDAGVAISGAIVNYQNLKIIPSTNYPVVTYNASGMRAKIYNGSTWSDVGASPIVTGNQVNHAMVVGSNDTVYVAVQIGTGYSVYKNHINATSTDAWQLVGNSGFTSGGSSNQFTVSLAIDANNNLYLAYRALATPDASKIAVYKYTAGNWAALGNQLFSGNAVEHISIAVTPAGVPTVAFRENNPTDKTIVYTLSGSTWTSLGAASATLGNYNSLILDNGVPVVAFCESTGVNGGLVTVKKYSPGTPVDSVIVTTPNNATQITTNAGTLQANAVVYPSSVNQNVTWSIVPGTGTASISTSGLVTAQSNGSVYAKAVSVADPSKMDSVQITIINQTVNVTGITVSTQNNVPAVITTNAGTLQAVATILPANATNQNVTWSIVAGTGTATISAAGLVTAQTNGTVYAKAVSVANPTVKDSILINISNQPIPASSLQVSVSNNAAAVINTQSGTLQMMATFVPVNASNQNVTWSIVPGTGAATISATGMVTAQSNGTVYAKAVSVANGALSDSVAISISNQSTTNVNELMAQLGLKVYPNPVQHELIMELQQASTKLSISLTDILGNVLYNGTISNGRVVIPMQSLPAGSYILHINGEGVMLHHKVLKY